MAIWKYSARLHLKDIAPVASLNLWKPAERIYDLFVKLRDFPYVSIANCSLFFLENQKHISDSLEKLWKIETVSNGFNMVVEVSLVSSLLSKLHSQLETTFGSKNHTVFSLCCDYSRFSVIECTQNWCFVFKGKDQKTYLGFSVSLNHQVPFQLSIITLY